MIPYCSYHTAGPSPPDHSLITAPAPAHFPPPHDPPSPSGCSLPSSPLLPGPNRSFTPLGTPFLHHTFPYKQTHPHPPPASPSAPLATAFSNPPRADPFTKHDRPPQPLGIREEPGVVGQGRRASVSGAGRRTEGGIASFPRVIEVATILRRRRRRRRREGGGRSLFLLVAACCLPPSASSSCLLLHLSYLASFVFTKPLYSLAIVVVVVVVVVAWRQMYTAMRFDLLERSSFDQAGRSLRGGRPPRAVQRIDWSAMEDDSRPSGEGQDPLLWRRWWRGGGPGVAYGTQEGR